MYGNCLLGVICLKKSFSDLAARKSYRRTLLLTPHSLKTSQPHDISTKHLLSTQLGVNVFGFLLGGNVEYVDIQSDVYLDISITPPPRPFPANLKGFLNICSPTPLPRKKREDGKVALGISSSSNFNPRSVSSPCLCRMNFFRHSSLGRRSRLGPIKTLASEGEWWEPSVKFSI